MSQDRLPDRVKRALHVRRNVGEQVPDDVESEIAFHLESRIDELRAEGHDDAEAERLAVAEFGDVELAKRALGRTAKRRERATRRQEGLDGMRRDLRFGWRKLRSSPGFTAAAVLTLALGIGATTAIFSTVHAVLLRPLPFPEPDRLVKVWETSPQGVETNVVSGGNYMAWREQAGSSFREMGAHSWVFGATVSGMGDPFRIRASRITPAALSVLGARTELGRTFTESEGVEGADAVVLLSHRLWADRFGRDPEVVGRTITLDDQPFTVVGVMPPSFRYPTAEVEAWTVLQMGADDANEWTSHQWNVVGRLADGVSVERAQAELDATVAALTQEHPAPLTGWGANVVPLRDDIVGEVRSLLWVLMAVVGVVLLLTCVNLANLLLARATTREREIAVRGALGAGRGRLVRQLLVESLLLGLLGGALALAVVVLGLDGLVALAPSDIPLLEGVRVDPMVLAFAVGATVVATLLFGLIPALRATATAPNRALRGARGSAGDGHHRLRSGLLVAEVALAVVLVVGAGLLLRSMSRLNDVDPGLVVDDLLVAHVDLPQARYPTTVEQGVFYRTLLDDVAGLPGVESVAGTTEPPMLGYQMSFSFQIEGRPADSPNGREDDERLAAVTPGYFRTLGIPIEEGRAIERSDRAGSTPVVVISRSLADKQWPDGGAVGNRIRFRENMEWLEIVGVAGDARLDGLDADVQPFIYIPFEQRPWDWLAWLALTVRTEGDAAALSPAVRDAVVSLDPRVIPERITTMESLYAESAARRRFATLLLGAFAVLALALGGIGIYGLLSYTVAQRRKEIGIRMALGAEPRQVARVVVRDALVIALVGVALGALAALVLSRGLQSLLFQVEPSDPATFVGACAVLLALAAASAWLPARSATRVDPVGAMREG